MVALFSRALTPLVDLFKQVLDVPVPQLGLQLVQQLFERTHWVLRDLPHLFLVLQVLSNALGDAWRRIDGRQSFDSGLGMLHLHLIDGIALIGYLILKKLHPVLQLVVLLGQALVLVLEKDQFLKDITHMLLSGRPRILLKLKVILKPLDFSLQISDYDLVLAVDLRLIVLLTEVDALVQLADHGIRLAVEVVEIGVFGQLDAGCVALSDTVYDGFKVSVVVLGRLDLCAHVFIVGDSIAIYLRKACMYIPSFLECCEWQGEPSPKEVSCKSSLHGQQLRKEDHCCSKSCSRPKLKVLFC